MKTFRQNGEVYDYTPSGAAVASGDVVVMGTVVGVAVTDIADGVQGAVSAYGVHNLAKVAATAIAQGAKVYWDASNSVATSVATSNTLMGVAFDAAASADTTINVKLAG